MQALDDDGDDALGDGGDDGFDVDALEIPDPLEEEEDDDDDEDGPIGLGDLVDAGLLVRLQHTYTFSRDDESAAALRT